MKSLSDSSIWVQYRKKYPADDVLQNTFEDMIPDVRRKILSSDRELTNDATNGVQASLTNVLPFHGAIGFPERPTPGEVADQTQPDRRTDVFAEFVEAWKAVGYGNGQHRGPQRRLNVLGWSLGG